MEPIADLLTQHEGKTLEFKRDLSSPENLLWTMVAFANGAGGTLLIGVNDRTRQVRGIAEPTRAGEQLANPRMTNACVQAGLPEPVFEEIGSGFRVTFNRQAAAGPRLDPIDQLILNHVRQSDGASTSQIAARIGRTTRAARTRLNRLVSLGLLATISSDPKDPRKVFRIAGKGR